MRCFLFLALKNGIWFVSLSVPKPVSGLIESQIEHLVASKFDFPWNSCFPRFKLCKFLLIQLCFLGYFYQK